MKNLYKQKREEGFTIIEVMIVLAIAAVILLIVLLAVPALQRNSRNTQRNNDAATIAAAVNTCLANHNNDITVATGCAKVSSTQMDVDTTKLGQLTTVTYGAGNGTTTTAMYAFGTDCNPSGTAQVASGNTHNFSVMFQTETSNSATPLNRCVSS